MSGLEWHLARVSSRHPLTDEERAAIRSIAGEQQTLPRRITAVREGVKLNHSMLLLEGMMCRAKMLGNGRRYVAELQISGDFVDLHGFTLKRLEHDIETLTACTVAMVPHAKLDAMFQQFPRLARIYWFHNNVDAANHREWALSLAQRSGPERVAALFCELLIRFQIIGIAEDNRFRLPLTQLDLGEHLGLTPIHINRVLRQLRETQLVTFRNGIAEIHDLPRLKEFASFDDRYLYLHPDPF